MASSPAPVDRGAWIKHVFLAAQDSGHIFPAYAACEAALESGYGSSKLAVQANNLFGMKQHLHAEFGTISLPTMEWSPKLKKFVPATAEWVEYPSVADCFRDRMETLLRLSTARNKEGVLEFPHYAAAIASDNGVTFITEVSQSWSTDPRRAQKVFLIYQEYAEAFQ